MATPAAVLQVLVTANTAQANAALARTQGQLTSTAATANKSSAATAKSTSRMSAAMAGAAKYGALALGAALVVGVKRSAEFEDQMMKVHTQAGATRQEVANLSKSVLEYARNESEANPIELAKGLFRIESAGYRGAKAMEMLAAAERLADVGGADMEETAKAVAGAMRSTIKGTGSLEKTIGTLNAIVGAGSMTMEELVAAMGTGFLTNAKQMGVSLKQAGAALAVLTEQNQSATASATRLSMAWRMMMAPTDTAKAALESIGLSATKLGTLMQAGQFPQALALLSEKLNALGDSPEALQKKAAVIKEVFGARSSAGIQALLVALDQYGAKLGQISEDAGKFREKEKADNDTLQSQWNRLKAIMDAWSISVGDAVKGPLKDLLKGMVWLALAISNVVGVLSKFDFSLVQAANAVGKFVSGVVNKIGNLPGFIKGALAGLAAILTVPFRAAIDPIRGIINKIISVVGNLKGAFNDIKGPVLAVVHGITNALKGIVRAVATVIQKFENMSDALPDLPKVGPSGLDVLEDIFGQKGLVVPGAGTGDKVRAMLEPGEVVLNRKAVQKLGGARRVNAINQAIPRFQGGGAIVQGIAQTGRTGVGMAGVSAVGLMMRLAAAAGGGASANWKSIDKLAKELHLSLTSTLRPGDSDSFHGISIGGGRARATDYSGGAGGMMEFFRRLVPLARKGKLRELFYDPGGGWDNGTSIGAIGGHMDHVHVALQKGGIIGDFARAGVDTKASKRAMFALFMAGLAESGMRDLPGGHSTSQGVLQLLASTARSTGIDPHNEYAVAKGFLTRGYWGKGGAISLAKQGKNAALIAHLVQGNATGTGVYSAQAGAAGDLLKSSGLRFPPGGKGAATLAKVAPKDRGKPKKGKTGPAWAPELPKWMLNEINRLGGEAGVIAKYADFASRAASLDTSVGGKDEAGWLNAQLAEIITLRNVLIDAYNWLVAMRDRYTNMILDAWDRIRKLKKQINQAQKGKGLFARNNRRNVPKWQAEIKNLKDVLIPKWIQRQQAVVGLLESEDGPLMRLNDLQGFVNPESMRFQKMMQLPIGPFGGQIQTVQEALKSLGENATAATGESPTGTDNSELLALQKQIADKLAQQLFVSQQQYAVLAQTPGPPYVGSFAQGGVVPRTGMAMVHKGEVIGAPQPIVILVKDGAVRSDYIQAISGREAERLLRRSGRTRGRVPGRAGSMT